MDIKYSMIILCVFLIALAGCSNAEVQANDEFCPAPGKSSLIATSTTEAGYSAEIIQPAATTLPTEDTSSLPKKEFLEGELVSFPNLATKDADGDTIAYKFSAPLGKDGKWQTKIGDAGEYVATITASDGKTETEQKLLLVIKGVNKAPVIEPIADITVNEGEAIIINAEAKDPEGKKVKITFSGWMTSDKRGTTFDDAGTYTVTVTASDGVLESKKDVRITIVNVNRQPIIKPVEDKVITEGDFVSIKTTAADPDNDKVIIDYPGPFDKDGFWQTKEGDAGEKTYTIIATDDKISSTTKVAVKVLPKNKAPVLAIASKNIVVEETETVKIDATATDPDGDKVTITFSGWMASDTKETTYSDAGTYTVTVKASDGKAETSETVSITVNDKNRPPQIII